MRRLERKPLAEAVYSSLLKKVMDGSFPPGMKLREESLCESLGVSRTPLREALIRLAKEGVLVRLPNRGCAVRERSASEIAELMECRSLLERLVLRERFASIDRVALASVERKLLAAKAEDGAKARRLLLEADEAIHSLILASCSNSILRERVAELQELCRPYRVFRCETAADFERIAAERLRMASSILRGSVAEAEAALAAHFAKSSAAFVSSR